MLNDITKYMSAAKTAADLALSIGSIQNMVTRGELKAMRTQGGHWRIDTHSIDAYRKAHNYRDRPNSGKICILHQGDDLDPLLVQSLDPDAIQLMLHPLELLGIEPHISVLFIDARYVLQQTMHERMIEGLQRKYKFFIYNSQVLPESSPFLRIPDLLFVPGMINAEFISGYAVAQRLEQKTQRGPLSMPEAVLSLG